MTSNGLFTTHAASTQTRPRDATYAQHKTAHTQCRYIQPAEQKIPVDFQVQTLQHIQVVQNTKSTDGKQIQHFHKQNILNKC